MKGAPLPDDLVAAAVVALRGVVLDVADQFGHRPTLAEVLEVLGLSVPHGSAALGEEIAIPLGFKVKLTGNRRYDADRPSRVDELNDSAFVAATDLLAVVADGVHAVLGERISAADLVGGLTQVLRTSGIEFDDVTAGQVSSMAPNAGRAAVKVKRGDLLAIPARVGGWRLAVVVASNQFGTAVGLFRDRYAVPRLGSDDEAAAVHPYPVYTEMQQLAKGVWRLVGHQPALLSRFPDDPEIYHSADSPWWNVDVGEFGAAENAAGRLRHIRPEEARTVGLTDGSYRQTRLSADLQEMLDAGE